MSRTPGLVSCLTHFSYPRHPLINLTDELTKTRKARPNQIPFFVLIAALISFAFRVVSDFLTFIAEWTRPRYEATRDTTQEYINNAGQKADEAKKYAEDRYHDARKYGEEAKGQAKETGEQAKEKAQETKEQGKEQANKAKK
jgi:F0F1-type ATP synthase membrane subunit b/b'